MPTGEMMRGVVEKRGNLKKEVYYRGVLVKEIYRWKRKKGENIRMTELGK